MKITVAICAYNAAVTIRATIDSVLQQRVQPHEVLVVDDGSTDNTLGLLESYKSSITIFPQAHGGVSSARNRLCQEARGDLIAFLDSDDIWHPRYLETQCQIANACPHAAAFFIGHVNFHGYGDYLWPEADSKEPLHYQAIASEQFIEAYNRCPSPFNSMSFCCIPKKFLDQLGPAPFPKEIGGVEDTYLFNVLPRLAPMVAFAPKPLVAYRITEHSLSSDQLKSARLIVNTFEILSERRGNLPRIGSLPRFKIAFASWRRTYAKLLFGAGKISEGRTQLRRSLLHAGSLLSLVKSFGLLIITCLPLSLQPRWPSRQRPY